MGKLANNFLRWKGNIKKLKTTPREKNAQSGYPERIAIVDMKVNKLQKKYPNELLILVVYVSGVAGDTHEYFNICQYFTFLFKNLIILFKHQFYKGSKI